MQLKDYRIICAKLDFKRKPMMLYRQLVIDASILIFIAYLMLEETLIGFLIAQALLAIVCFRSFALMHEAVHHSVVRNSFINEAVGVVTGILCFLPYESWKRLHLEHHTWAGNIDKDPALKLRKDFNPNQKVKNFIVSKVWRSWLPLLGLLQTVVFWKYPIQQLRDPNIPRSEKALIAVSALVPLVFYAGLWGIWPHIFNLKNFGLAIFLFLMMLENINAPHHLEVEEYNGETKLPLLKQHLVTRTGYYPPAWVGRFFFLNFNLHTEHHLFPSLPWYQLDQARPLVKAVLGEEYNETFRNSWVRKNRKRDLSELIEVGIDDGQVGLQKAG